jgi:phage terminase small subunit
MLRETSRIGANSVHSALPAAVPSSQLSDKHEAFVTELMRNGGRLVDAYRAVYPNAGSMHAIKAHSARLRARRDVSERIDALTRIAAQAAVIDRSVLLADLYALATASPDELVSVVTLACDVCWPDDGVAIAAVFDSGDVPDTDGPRKGCPRCKGRGVKRLHVADTAELSSAARLLYQGAEYKPDGSIKVHVADRLAARKELHELLGLKVSRSESKNLNVNMNVPAPADLSAEDLLAQYKALRELT